MPDRDADMKAFDSHGFFESILRYTPNPDCFRQLRDNAYGEHLTVGFGPGTCMIGMLTELPYFHTIDYSSGQIANGKVAGPKLLELFNYQNRHGSLDIRAVSSVLPEVSSLKPAERKKVVADLDLMFGVLGERGRVPTIKEVRASCGRFKKFTEFYDDRQFDTLDVCDVLPHISHNEIPDIFFEIKRVLKPSGVAVVTYFPSTSGSVTGRECADTMFLRLAKEMHVSGSLVYDSDNNVIHPKAIGIRLKAQGHPNYDELLRQYWLDLEDFNLQDKPFIRKVCKENELSIEEEKFIPGGMLNTARYGIVVKA